MLRTYVVGCGGIGGYITQLLSECCASLCLDYLEKHHIDITPYMANAGNCVLPSIVRNSVLQSSMNNNSRISYVNRRH